MGYCSGLRSKLSSLMAKRKLNRRQQWRIEKVQSERAERAKRRAERADALIEEGDLGKEQLGTVISHFGTQIDVQPDNTKASESIQRCHIRANLGSIVTGDRVVWRSGDEIGVVTARLERSSELTRPDNHGNIKPVAANIDLIVIVVASEPEHHANLIDRYLVAAEQVEIEPLILINKADLLDSVDNHPLRQLAQTYRSLGYQVVESRAHEQGGTSDLHQAIKGKTLVFVGQSGVGKSSLVASLLEDDSIKIGDLSETTRKGRHTTTTARLYYLANEAELIDSPGVREFGLWHITAQEVLSGFIEMRPFIGECQFRDCAHKVEPGCAILAAVDQGMISESRFFSYQQILESLENH